ncbi:MAG TPA: hypothetical protein VGJ86_17905 [Acidimicrobiales bacterium]|jgi:hypothetical protein
MLSFYNAAGQTHVLAATAFVLYDAAGEVHLIVDVFGLFTDSSGPSVRPQR